VNKIASRLGLRGKRLETPMAILRARFNMVWESETVDRVKQYRIWTHKNYVLYKAASMPMRPQMVPSAKAFTQTNSENSLAIVEQNVEDTNEGSCGAEQPVVIKEVITSSSSGAQRKDWRYPCIPTNSSAAIRELRILQKLMVCAFLNVSN
jgi:hypothetical protein